MISPSPYEEVVASLRNQDFLVNFSNLLNSFSPFETRISKALKILGRYIKVNRIYIFENINTANAKNTYEWVAPSVSSRKKEGNWNLYAHELSECKNQLIKDGIVYITNSSSLTPTLKQILNLRQAQSIIALPCFIRNDLHGFIGIDSCDEIREWNNMDIGFLKTIAAIISNAFEHKQMERNILSAIIQTEEKERSRLAQDLHDGLGPLLSSLKMYTKVLGTTNDSDRRCEMLLATTEVIDEAMLLIKEISNNLSPHVLNDFGLASAIQSFCKKISLTKEIDIRFDSNVFEVRFDSEQEVVLFRVLKELVNNTIKHALATQIEIFLLRTEQTLSLIYSDNGIGFDIHAKLDNRKSGMGIANIVNRIKAINGKLVLESQKGKGIQVKIEVDLK